MRLATIEADTGTRLAAVAGDQAVDLTGALETVVEGRSPASVSEVIAAGPALLATIERLLERGEADTSSLADHRLVAPHVPATVFCVGANYREHADEGDFDVPDDPTWFAREARSFCGPYDDIVVPLSLTRALDWEIELGVIVGRGGRDIRTDAALDHVFGYTIVNDVSARDVQLGRGQWFLGKNLARTAPIGPYVVTVHDVPDPQALELSLAVDGEVMQQARTSEMTHTVAELIADLSRYLELRPGDVISTGTPAGVGGARTPPRFLQDGADVETEIAGLGHQRNRVRLVEADGAAGSTHGEPGSVGSEQR